MIWFQCKQCGKTHGRPDNSVGSMIFCECGQGLVVPWESTVAAPVTLSASAAPLTLPSSPGGGGRGEGEGGAAAPMPTAIPLEKESGLPEILPRVRRRWSRRRPDPAYCLNHETVASQHKCPDCGEAFCGDCVLTFQGTTLCGPCKNYRARRMVRPPRLSGLALSSALLALITGPLVFCLSPFAVSSGTSLLSLLALLPQLLALGLGALALRATETDAKCSGRSLAITGMVTAGVSCVLTLAVSIFVNRPLG
jgi:hypothetical protein